MAILDADFLSSFFKIGKLKLILKVLNVKHVVVPSTVYEELKDARFFNEIASLFAFNEKELNDERFILVKAVDLVTQKENFTKEETITLGKGELGCFILAKDGGDTILIDDQKARMVAKGKGLKVASIPAFLLFCKKKNIISLDGVLEIIEKLKEKDYYEFSEESKELLLK
jgi:predicted nucleic acid-binding protein